MRILDEYIRLGDFLCVLKGSECHSFLRPSQLSCHFIGSAVVDVTPPATSFYRHRFFSSHEVINFCIV